MKKIVVFCFLLLLIVAPAIIFFKCHSKENSPKVFIDLTFLEEVCKLSTVEAQFTEIYIYEPEKTNFNFLFEKRIIIKMTAKVSYGYDLKNKNIVDIDTLNKILYVNLPKSEILYIEHDIQEFDRDLGFFESFTSDDNNFILKDSKNKIKTLAKDTLDKIDKSQSIIKLFERVYPSWKIVIKQ